jgi:hypothetical protein
VLRSEGPGQPFVTRLSRDASVPLSFARQLWAANTGDLFFLTSEQRTLQVHRSTNQGASFAPVSRLTLDTPVESALVHPQGPLFVMLRDPLFPLRFQVGFSPDAATTAPVLRDGFSAADAGKLVVDHGLWLPTASGAWLVLNALLNDGTGSHARVLLREYDLAGTIVSERTVDPQLKLGHYLWPVGASLSGDGALLWVTATEARRFELTTGALSVATLPGKNLQSLDARAPVRLADGRLLLATTELIDPLKPHLYRAGYRLSTDGLNWGPLQVLRPTGGDAQSVVGVAAEPDGAALFLLQDSGLMMAGDGEVVPQVLVQRVVP